MCTAMVMNIANGDTYFGRTMDFSYLLDPELYLMPKGYEWINLLKTHTIHNQYSFMGIGQDISPLVFADGFNEMGFSVAALYFPDFAQFDSIESQDVSKISISAIELAGFLLGLCASVEQASALLPTIRIVGVKDSVTNSVAPLHWMIADNNGKCMVIEKTADGLHLMNNPIGVLSNSPDFSWHMTNLRNYMNVSNEQNADNDWSGVKLTPFGQGAGTFGLPGDYTPPSRFVRTAFQKSHAFLPSAKEEAVNTCFHIMEGVSIPKGCVMTHRKTYDFTQYTTFMNLSSKEYFFKTYDNCQIVSVKMPVTETKQSEIVSLGKLNRPIVFETWKNKGSAAP